MVARRVLSFLYTPYFDDVKSAKTKFDRPCVELVAISSGSVVGVLDAELFGKDATVDTIAVHPDHQSRAIGTAMFEALLVRLHEAGVRTVDAWTRDQPEVLGWYRVMGFTGRDHYDHLSRRSRTRIWEKAGGTNGILPGSSVPTDS